MSAADLLHMAAHDLSTPLGCLMLQAEMLRRSLTPGDTNRRRVDAIISGGHQLIAITKRLGELSRLEAGNIQLKRSGVDPCALALAIAEQLDAELGRGRVHLVLGVNLPRLDVDRARIEKAMVTLVVNAVRRNGSGAAQLKVERARGGLCWALLPCATPEGATFGPTPGRRESLELYLSALVVATHGGTVEDQSELSDGAIWRATLPARTSGT